MAVTSKGRDAPDPDADAGSGRKETEKERLDRNLGELLQELRVALPGVQVLFAFLLVVPFNQRFPDITTFQRTIYFITLLLATAATACLIDPRGHPEDALGSAPRTSAGSSSRRPSSRSRGSSCSRAR